MDHRRSHPVSRGAATVAAGLIAAIAGSLLFVAAYACGANRLLEGLSLALATAGFAAPAIGWARGILAPETVVDHIDDYPSSREQRCAQDAEIVRDERAVARPVALVRLLYAAAGVFIAALAVPLRSLGPAPDGALFHTRWRPGDRMLTEDGRIVTVNDLNVGAAIAVFPESAPRDAQSQATLIRLPEDEAANSGGFIAYSRVCTHAGCPVALYRPQTKQLLCPCHQSVFAVTQNGAVVSGPADHPLPRLPIDVGGDGILRAAGDFPVPVGPGFWERG